MRNEALHRICAEFLVAGCLNVMVTVPAGAVFGVDATGGVAIENSESAAIEISGQAAGWPQFRGPNRDGKSPETGLLKRWPEAGPSLVRTISGVGGGFSSPVIAEERIFITGKIGDDLKIFCFDGSGRKVWERTHAPAFSEANAPHSPYPGARATPTIDGDTIYLLGGLGRLVCSSDGRFRPHRWPAAGHRLHHRGERRQRAECRRARGHRAG